MYSVRSPFIGIDIPNIYGDYPLILLYLRIALGDETNLFVRWTPNIMPEIVLKPNNIVCER